MITSIDKTIDGAWEITAFLRDRQGEYLHTERFYGYTKREALKMFRQKIKEK
jgi:hypothetical protein